MPLRTPNEMGIIGIGRHHYQKNYFKKETEYLAADGNGMSETHDLTEGKVLCLLYFLR